MSLIGNFNNEEYKKENIHLPLSKPCKLTKDNKWIENNTDYSGITYLKILGEDKIVNIDNITYFVQSIALQCNAYLFVYY